MSTPIKIGILTFHFSDNFGAALQAFALRKWFINQGYDASFINYCPSHVEHGGSIRFSLSKKAMISNLKVLYLKYSYLKARFFGSTAQKNAFEEFRLNDLGVTTKRISSLVELSGEATHYNLLVCGSDQIWSPSVQHGLDPAYFLNFGSVGPRKISYAASFGNATLDSLKSAGAADLLQSLDSVSVREKSGLNLVNELIGRPCIQVADPTVLLNGYEDLIENTKVEDIGHIFCYALRTDKGVREIANYVREKLRLPIVTPSNPHSRWAPIGETRNPGPREWLALISSSAFVVTNSFHGTMFSILLEKPFVVAGIPGKKTGLNDRMISLLEDLGLLERFVSQVDENLINNLVAQPIDWKSVRSKLDALRGKSEKYLRTEIESAGV